MTTYYLKTGMFADLATIIVDQGILLDNAHGKLTKVRESVNQAETDLEKGAKYHKDTRNRMCCMAFFLIVATLVGLLILSHIVRRI